MDELEDIGEKGEKLAVEFLVNKGYKILATNWRYKHKEIDIISRKDDFLVVVEVKTRSSNYFENPQDSINRKKQKFIIEAANAYIYKNNIHFETRFDIIAIIISGEKIEIEHIENAFYPLVRRF
jgi:putative endonuclease